MPCDAIILCGGKGERLQSITRGLPKSMVLIGETPFLDLLIKQLIGWKILRVILAVGYKKHIIMNHYACSPLRNYIDIVFSEEATPLGTGGAIQEAERYLTTPDFLVLNGDTFCSIQFDDFFNYHRVKKSLLTMAVTKQSNDSEVGTLYMNTKNQIEQFSEKTIIQKKENHWVNAGVYLMTSHIFQFFPNKTSTSLEFDILPNLPTGETYGFPFGETFMDIGTPERLERALKALS